MFDRQDRAVRRTQALIGRSRNLCALTESAVRHSREAIATTSALLAEAGPHSSDLHPRSRRRAGSS